MTRKYLVSNEKLMKEWDWERNAEFNPSRLTYEAKVADRVRWSNCPYCGYIERTLRPTSK